jgi:hypothetical protein
MGEKLSVEIKLGIHVVDLEFRSLDESIVGKVIGIHRGWNDRRCGERVHLQLTTDGHYWIFCSNYPASGELGHEPPIEVDVSTPRKLIAYAKEVES